MPPHWLFPNQSNCLIETLVLVLAALRGAEEELGDLCNDGGQRPKKNVEGLLRGGYLEEGQHEEDSEEA